MADKQGSIFDLEEFKPYKARWTARIKELSRRSSYYDGSVYGGDGKAMDIFSKLARYAPSLRGQIRPLYLPLSRAVDVDAGIIPGDWKLAEDMPEDIVKARDDVFDWSEWNEDGVLYVHYAAQYGLTGLRIADLREQHRVILQPADPTTFMLVDNGLYDQWPRMSIQVESKQGEDGKTFEYAEVITSENIRTFKNGKPEGFDGRKDEEVNALKFVPFVEKQFIKTGAQYGEATYNKAIPLLDEVNTHATFLSDVIAKHTEPQWAIFGAEPSQLQHDGDVVWFISNPEGRVQALVPGVDIAAILEFIREIRDNVHGALPELAFDELKKKDQIATPTLELQLMELVLKVKRVRPNLDAGLVTALRMAGAAAKTMNLGDIAVLDDESLALDSNREILPMDPETRIQLRMQEISLEREEAALGGEGMSQGE